MNLFICFISNTKFSLIVKIKQNLISYYNASFFLLFFEIVRMKKYVNILSNIAALSPSASCRRCRCWHLVVVVGVLASAPRHQSWRRRCFVVVGSGVSSCGCIRRLLRLVVVDILLLLLAVASRRSLKILVYIRLTMHVTTMEPQH